MVPKWSPKASLGAMWSVFFSRAWFGTSKHDLRPNILDPFLGLFREIFQKKSIRVRFLGNPVPYLFLGSVCKSFLDFSVRAKLGPDAFTSIKTVVF